MRPLLAVAATVLIAWGLSRAARLAGETIASVSHLLTPRER